MTVIRQPNHREIAARAYQLFLQRGREAGHEMDDWLQAEYELIQLPVHKIAELPPPVEPQSKSGKSSIVELVQKALPS